MNADRNKFTHVAVTRPTQRKVALLAKVLNTNIYGLVEFWAETEWKNVLKAGLVTETMINTTDAKKFAKVDS